MSYRHLLLLFSILDIFENVMEKVEKKIQMLASNKMAVFFLIWNKCVS